MKIALCLSGHLRTFDKIFPSLKEKVIDVFGCDVFIHTWDTVGGSAGCDRLISTHSTSEKLDIINQLYNPKKIVIERFNRDQFADKVSKVTIPPSKIIGNIYNFCGMFYSIKRANEIRREFEIDNNLKYDYIIRCRTDLWFNSKLDNSILPPPNQLSVGFLAGHYLNIKCKFSNLNSLPFQVTDVPEKKCGSGINDQFAIGNDSAMNIYCGAFDIIEECNHFPELRPELILRYQIDKHLLEFSQHPIYYAMIRSDEFAVLSLVKPPMLQTLPPPSHKPQLLPSLRFPHLPKPETLIPTSSLVNPRLPPVPQQPLTKSRNKIVKSTAFPSPIYRKIK